MHWIEIFTFIIWERFGAEPNANKYEIRAHLRWEFIKENKEVRGKENTLPTKKVRFKKNDNDQEKRRKGIRSHTTKVGFSFILVEGVFLYFTLLFLFSFICKYSNLSVCLTVSLFFLEMSSSVRISCDNIIKPQNNWMFLFMLCIFTQNGSVKTDIRMKWYSWKMWTLNRSFWRFRLQMYK